MKTKEENNVKKGKKKEEEQEDTIWTYLETQNTSIL